MISTKGSGYLLDTNVLSAVRDPQRHPLVADFLRPLDSSLVFISVMTLGELHKGLEAKRARHANVAALERWIEQIEERYMDRVIEVGSAVARRWGELSAGRSRPAVDTLLAATAIVHDLSLVTRNVADFNDLPVRWINPWAT